MCQFIYNILLRLIWMYVSFKQIFLRLKQNIKCLTLYMVTQPFLPFSFPISFSVLDLLPSVSVNWWNFNCLALIMMMVKNNLQARISCSSPYSDRSTNTTQIQKVTACKVLNWEHSQNIQKCTILFYFPLLQNYPWKYYLN